SPSPDRQSSPPKEQQSRRQHIPSRYSLYSLVKEPAEAASPSGEGAFTDIPPPCQRRPENTENERKTATKPINRSQTAPKKVHENEKYMKKGGASPSFPQSTCRSPESVGIYMVNQTRFSSQFDARPFP
ncbi:hypothetical protein, partial [Komagataeibacter oboediens]|uniref:hypothetical protein n=1 Tax=Komagataeibacter oboediens TaxID=65958 RepID=UPI001C64FF68